MAAAKENTSLAIVAPQEAALALPNELQGFTGLETISSEIWVIPRMRIIQPTSKDGKEEGQFVMNLTGDKFPKLSTIVVKAVQGRAMWDKDPAVQTPLCRSYDFMTPDVSVKNPPSPVCANQVMGKKGLITKAVCPMMKWGVDAKGKPKRPECSETFNLLCILSGEYLPFWITLHGMNIAPVSGYLSAIALRRAPLWQYCTTISLEETTNDKGRFYVTSFAPPTPISKEMEKAIIPMVISLKDVEVKRSDEDVDDEGYEEAAPIEKPAFMTRQGG